MVTLLLVTSKAEAAQMKTALLTLGDSRPAAATSHLFTFTHTSAATVKKITFEYCNDPSGTCGTNTTVITGVTVGSENLPDAWTVSNNSQTITLTSDVAAGSVLTADYATTISFNGISNGAMSDACDGNGANGTDTCFVRIDSWNSAGTVIVDSTVVTYTLVDAVTVEAKVDPTFTFVVSAVNLNTVHNEITTSVTSTSNSLPFGSLQAGTPKYAAHALAVTTNTQGGYTVTSGLATQLTGIYTDNNIDPFVAPWTSPTTWTEPTGGTPNDNTGWFGANTTDVDVPNWNGPKPQFFGGIANGSSVTVMRKASSDNGTVPDYVTYAIEANVFQPSDLYRGILTYNALPTY